ncbi:MAG: hypothetical protein ACLS48_13675 [[Eubacterium] siraeum]
MEIYSVENERTLKIWRMCRERRTKEDEIAANRNAYCNGRTGGEAHQCRVFR